MPHLFRFDVMIGERFFCSMAMPYNPCFPIEYEELTNYIETQKPSLKRQNYHIEFWIMKLRQARKVTHRSDARDVYSDEYIHQAVQRLIQRLHTLHRSRFRAAMSEIFG